MPSTQTDRIGGLSTSVAIKAPVACATVANITLSGEQTIDGIAVTATGNGGHPDRVLVKAQTNAVDNGIWEVSTGAWSRARDFDGNRDITQGTLVFVYGGTENGRRAWHVTTDGPVVVGTTAINFELWPEIGTTAELVTYGAGTVADALDDHAAALAEHAVDITALEGDVSGLNALSAKNFGATIAPVTIDMHYGVLHGHGWTSADPVWSGGDPQNIKSTTTTSAVSASAMDIPVASSTGFTAGMMICWVASDGQYYSAKLHSIEAGPSFRIGSQVPVAISSGGAVYNLYRDDAHPNTHGGACIVDDALRRLDEYRIRRLEYRQRNGSVWEAILGATLTSQTTVDYGNPGSSEIPERAISVFSNTTDAGARSTIVTLQGGDYIASIPVNKGLRTGGFSGAVEVYIDETIQSGETFTIATSGTVSGYDSIDLIDVPFSCRPGAMISVRITSPNSGGFTFYVGPLSFYRLGERLSDINRGTHVLFGDSWFSVGSAMATRFASRLDNATVIVEGVGGNKASDLLARFGTDVTPNNPDYVWVCVGTNDYYASVTPELFEQQILQLRRLIQSIGALPIFFNASVGAETYTPEQLTGSREYALRVRYEDIAPPAIGAGVALRSANFHGQALSIGAGVTTLVGVTPGRTRGPAVLRSALLNQTSIEVLVNYPTAADGAGANDTTTLSGSAIYADELCARPTDATNRMIAVSLKNPTGSTVVVSYAIDLCWHQDL